MTSYRENFGFTLAEVLITLGIIGVVAALTIPNMMTDYEKKRVAATIKKDYSELYEAIKLAEIRNGDFEYWDFSIVNDYSISEKFIDKYLLPYLKLQKCSANSNIIKQKCGYIVSDVGAHYLLPSGSLVSFRIMQTSPEIYTIIDINGPKKPNVMGTDTFYFVIKDGKILPAGWHDGITREKILNSWYGGCNPYTVDKNNGISLLRHGCTALLMIDNWEFKDDYPFKQKAEISE